MPQNSKNRMENLGVGQLGRKLCGEAWYIRSLKAVEAFHCTYLWSVPGADQSLRYLNVPSSVQSVLVRAVYFELFYT